MNGFADWLSEFWVDTVGWVCVYVYIYNVDNMITACGTEVDLEIEERHY